MKLPLSEFKTAAWLIGVLALLYFLPVGTPRFDGAVNESLELARWYAREHVILCLLPAFFIAGAIGAFIRKDSVIACLGGKARPVVAYGVASISGTVLAVCSAGNSASHARWAQWFSAWSSASRWAGCSARRKASAKPR